MIVNPLSVNSSNYFKNTYSVKQISTIYDQTSSIIDNFDEYALQEIFSGNEGDVDKLLEYILVETGEAYYGQLALTTSSLKVDIYDYGDRVAKQFEEQLRIRSLNYFIMSVLPQFDLGVHNLEWGQFSLFYKRLCIEAARDHGKSFYWSFAYPLWKMYRYRRNNPYLPTLENKLNKEGMIITDEHSLAKDFLKKIKEEVENNPILSERLYPDKADGWGMEEINCKNGAILQIKGSSSGLRGRHPGWMVIDDLLNESQLYSKEQREKSISMFDSVIMNMIENEGQLIVVGTPFHEADLYAHLKQSKGWRVFEYPAINPDGTVLYPERHSFQSLLDKRDTIGSINFSREILVRPISSESSIFPYSMIKTCFDPTIKIVDNIMNFPKKLAKVGVGIDFAISANVGADYTVYTVLGVDERGIYYLLHMFREKGMTYNQQLAKLQQLKRAFNPDIIMAENNGFQQVILDLAKDMGINVVPHTTTTNKYDLRTGLPGMSVVFEQMRIRLPMADERSKGVVDTFVQEATGVTWSDKGKLENTTTHDDCVMSLWIAIKSLNYTHKKQKMHQI